MKIQPIATLAAALAAAFLLAAPMAQAETAKKSDKATADKPKATKPAASKTAAAKADKPAVKKKAEKPAVSASRTSLKSAAVNVAAGIQAAEAAMTPAELEQALRRYRSGTMPYAVYPTPASDAIDIRIETLPPSADALFPLSIRLNYAQRGTDGPQLLARVRAAAERWPDDRLARMTLAKAEVAWGTTEAAEAALTAVLAADPVDVEALRWMARMRMTAAQALRDEAGGREQADTLNRQARAFLSRALVADPDDYRLYLALGRSRRTAPDYPTDNDLNIWTRAIELAPQVTAIRGEASEVFARAGQIDTAIALLLPLANDPHGGAMAARARANIQALRPDAEAPDEPEVVAPEGSEDAPAPPEPVAPEPDAG